MMYRLAQLYDNGHTTGGVTSFAPLFQGAFLTTLRLLRASNTKDTLNVCAGP